MAQYIKPSINLIETITPLSVAGACTTSAEDLQMLGEIFGITDWKTAFAEGESCEVKISIEQYCKFTAVENGASTVVLGS